MISYLYLSFKIFFLNWNQHLLITDKLEMQNFMIRKMKPSTMLITANTSVMPFQYLNAYFTSQNHVEIQFCFLTFFHVNMITKAFPIFLNPFTNSILMATQQYVQKQYHFLTLSLMLNIGEKTSDINILCSATNYCWFCKPMCCASCQQEFGAGGKYALSQPHLNLDRI